MCDIAFLYSPSDHLLLLLLIKVCGSAQPWTSFNFFPYQAVVLSIAGEHVDAISRIDDLIADSANTPVDAAVFVVQVRQLRPLSDSVTTDIFNRHICTFSLGTSIWRAETTSGRFSRLKTRELNWATALVNHR